jgi:hypothetical protein
VTNIFILDYQTRLKSWVDLRNKIIRLPVDVQIQEIDRFWQRVPIQQHYLHTDFMKDWPDPWQLLSDNLYCYYARALGMIYTLLLLETKNIELVEAKDDNNNEVVLVLVDDAKYLMNYWPDTVVNNHIKDFTITRSLDISPLYSKIGL